MASNSIEGLGKGWKVYELSSAGQQPNLRFPIMFSMQDIVLNSVMRRLDKVVKMAF